MKKVLFATAICIFAFSFQACNSKSGDQETKEIEQAQSKDADSSVNSSLNDLNADIAKPDSTASTAKK
ncbi:MAG: hypothetical protein WCK02_11780 [Bacteroidota bacterium]